MARSVVVVGVDGTPSARAALGWAGSWATLIAAELRAVYVISPPHLDPSSWYPGAADWASYDEATADDRERMAVTRMFDELHSGPRWTLETVRGPAGPVLIEASEGTGLLVVGTRHLRGLKRVLDGSVSEYCLRHSVCPVVVVPAPSVVDTGVNDGRVAAGR